ncbi:hypothetical protein AVT65_gp20 [Gordonia phage Gmala1]|uniref:Uncharacterized protein n=2 Tax=Gordtnkvirus gordtnk2 TaxID=1982219 RepID=A0A0E3X9S6_9CAUD|nr:hypothetical protein AVT65_gp20 [Gordonia phage Gmala1]YP_009223928.1 hypothetical protein AXJ10_gp20 [Gordonia phage GordTnk2]AKC02760.1 hypothetical protein GordTnk2_20 [Gordonia phage GordTnk2]AKC02858.1 hypothetical protein Gmala1_20 [Gordonia phage Gmala1]
MAFWDEVSEGEWGPNPIFPKSQGTWIPASLFTMAQNLNIDPVVTLTMIANIANDLDIEVTPQTDIISILMIGAERQASLVADSSINVILGLHVHAEWLIESAVDISRRDNLTVELMASISGNTDIALLQKLAVEQGLLQITETGINYVGPQTMGTETSVNAVTGMISISALAPSLAATIDPVSAFQYIGSLQLALNATAAMNTELEMIPGQPVYGIIKTNTTTGSGTSYNTLTGMVADSNYPFTQISAGAALEIPSGVSPYVAYVRAEVPHTGGTAPRYGQTRIMRNGSEAATGSQQTASPGTSSAEWIGTVSAGDYFVIHWRGEGNFFNRPVAQPGAFLRVHPY